MLLMHLNSSKKVDKQVWFHLWSHLCHQGDVYETSYASVPHIVNAFLRLGKPTDFNFFLLPASIELARIEGQGPEVPVYLEKAYFESLQELLNSVSEMITKKWDSNLTKSIIYFLSIIKGHPNLAEKLDQVFEE